MILLLTSLLLAAPVLAEEGSLCFGTTGRGALEDGCQLPLEGPNFQPYAAEGVRLGRTYVHCAVARVVSSAYSHLQESRPETIYVYGESGLAAGGPFPPHKTHQNGLSVDFMVPVVDEKERSVALPGDASNHYGYDLEFDETGRLGSLAIDFPALADHLLALKRASAAAELGIARVTFDPGLQPLLHETPTWPAIQDLPFTRRSAWVRHDEHFHVDFAVSCAPLDQVRAGAGAGSHEDGG